MYTRDVYIGQANKSNNPEERSGSSCIGIICGALSRAAFKTSRATILICSEFFIVGVGERVARRASAIWDFICNPVFCLLLSAWHLRLNCAHAKRRSFSLLSRDRVEQRAYVSLIIRVSLSFTRRGDAIEVRRTIPVALFAVRNPLSGITLQVLSM